MSESKVRLSHYDGRWRQEYEQMRSCLLDACEGMVTAVEHIGSTVLPSAIARPQVDLLAGVADEVDVSEALGLIEGLNFRVLNRPNWFADEGSHFLQKTMAKTPSFNVVLTTNKGPLWYRLMRMKLWLDTHPHDLQRLVQVKIHLIHSSNEVGSYERGKSIFFTALEDQMDAAGGK